MHGARPRDCQVAAQSADRRAKFRLTIETGRLAQQYIQASVYNHIQNGTLTYVNEMRSVSIVFIQVQGVDVSTPS